MQMLDYQFTDKRVSPWGGIRMIHELYHSCGLRDIVRSSNLKEPGSNRGYCPYDIVEGFMTSVILGAKRLSHSALLQDDEVIKEIFDWKKGMCSQSTFSRFFGKYDFEDNEQIFPKLQSSWFSMFDIDRVTIDIDSTVITRYGEQQGVNKGYNKKKRGRGSHHPILAFVAELKMVANAWMRPGDSSDATNFQEFLDELFEVIPVDRIGLLRLDAGFYGNKALQRFEDEGLNYIVAAHFKQALKRRVQEQEQWTPFMEHEDSGMDYCSFEWKATGWLKPRRFVIIRKDIEKNPKQGGKLLFPDLEEFESYRYTALVTNVEVSPVMVWKMYNQRADSENRIKELKHDYGIEGFCLNKFGSTENAFRWTMVAHNLMALFRLKVLKNRKHLPTLSTLNFQCIAIGSYLSRSARKTVLNLAAGGKKKRMVEEIFAKLGGLSPPFSMSNA